MSRIGDVRHQTPIAWISWTITAARNNFQAVLRPETLVSLQNDRMAVCESQTGAKRMAVLSLSPH